MPPWRLAGVAPGTLHAITDDLGHPRDFVRTGGPGQDATQGEVRLALTPAGAEAFIGDQGYVSDTLVPAIEARDIKAVLPPRRHRTKSREVAWCVDQERPLIECFFNTITHYRSIFARHEKPSRHYRGLLRFGTALTWRR